MTGRVEAIHVAPRAGAPMQAVAKARAIAGAGLAGDRYQTGSGYYSTRPLPGGGRQLTRIEAEALEALRHETGIALTPAESRRNVTTRGVRLNDLVGRRFYVGEVLCEGVRLCEPCAYLEDLTGKAVNRPLVHRGGHVTPAVHRLSTRRVPALVCLMQDTPHSTVGAPAMTRHTHRSLPLVALCLALIACSSFTTAPHSDSQTRVLRATTATPPPATATAAPAGEILTVGTPVAAPMLGCSTEEVARLVTSFFGAFNRGDRTALRAYFPDTDAGTAGQSPQIFQWYSVTDGPIRHFAADNQQDLFSYFAQRHEQREHLQLRMIRVDEDRTRGLAHISYLLTRRADDLAPELGGPERIAQGKGAIHCAARRIVVWSMAMSLGDTAPRPCPEPPSGTPLTTVVACGPPDR